MSFILAQWAIETGYGGWDWSTAHNPGNVGSYDGQPVNVFPSLQVGVNAYVQTIKLGYYNAVRAATTPHAQGTALGYSPWASAHYALPGGAPGSEINWVIDNYNLTQYDWAAPTPAPTPPTPPIPVYQGDDMIAGDPQSKTGSWALGSDGGVFTADGAQFYGSMAGNRFNWTAIGALAGIAPWWDGSGWGYKIAVHTNQPGQFAYYRFPSNGSLKSSVTVEAASDHVLAKAAASDLQAWDSSTAGLVEETVA
jgi:hypothetical protein